MASRCPAPQSSEAVRWRGKSAAGCQFRVCCDEYPFASTWQGASTGSGDFSRRMINATQNEDGGRALSRFYLYNRIIENDKYLVWIK